ncbi:chemotaxis protein CheD [Haloterrigena salifodinae]|uniref:chemotaxis protein CheD n=1 Tax=Haloterrigena salifodinae TaxID=2675099 RepID=UPI000F89D47E|nr:chemotaxis protein CheD [Haloterrigena salifodinae]
MSDDANDEDGGITIYGADDGADDEGDDADDLGISVYTPATDDDEDDGDDDEVEVPVYGESADDSSADEDSDADGDNGDGDDDDFEIPVFGDSDDPEPTADPISVGVAEYAITDEGRPLRTSGLGSCLGLVVHDDVRGVSGLLHFMLPRAAESNGQNHSDAKFADTGIAAMLSAFVATGGDLSSASAKLAGGATMVDFDRVDTPIGSRNVEAARRELSDNGVEVVAEDTGGDAGRSLRYDPQTDELRVTGANGTERTL